MWCCTYPLNKYPKVMFQVHVHLMTAAVVIGKIRHPLLNRLHFWFMYDLRQRYHALQVQPDPGSNS